MIPVDPSVICDPAMSDEDGGSGTSEGMTGAALIVGHFLVQIPLSSRLRRGCCAGREGRTRGRGGDAGKALESIRAALRPRDPAFSSRPTPARLQPLRYRRRTLGWNRWNNFRCESRRMSHACSPHLQRPPAGRHRRIADDLDRVSAETHPRADC